MTKYIKYQDDAEFLQINTSEREVKVFIDSSLHEDFQRELNLRMEMLDNMIDDPELKYTGRDYDVFRGGKRAFLEVRNLFNDIYDGIIERNINVDKED